MGIYKVKDKYLIFKGEKESEIRFRKELSELLLKEFGRNEHNAEEIALMIKYSLDFFVSKFKDICFSETFVRFYQHVFKFHEEATEAAYNHPHEDLSDDIPLTYIATYRRILKLIIETGCEVKMQNNEETNEEYTDRFKSKLSDLIYLGEMIYTCTSLYAEQSMIEDVADIYFDNYDLFVFSRRHHYDFIFEHMSQDINGQLGNTVIDDSGLSGFEDLQKAFKNCFDIDYSNVGHLIATIHEMNKLKGGDIVGVDWKTLTHNMETMFGTEIKKAEVFFSGLKLNNENKMDLLDCACKQYKLNRYLYKPVIIWNVDGEDYAFFGKSSWMESMYQLASNTIPWGKAHEEWMKNDCFKKYVHKKEDDHDGWLDDAVEKIIVKNEMKYERNLTRLIHNNGNTSFNIQGLGEIDFIILSEKSKTIFIVDCKHLVGRYDIPSQKNDYNVFTKGRKPYNETMKRKLEWFTSKKQLIEEHFQIKYDTKSIDLSNYDVEGIFIVNTPTLYMYNSEYRIYTIRQIKDVLMDEFIDPIFNIFIDEGDIEKMIRVNYPYFKKPEYKTIDIFE